MININILNASGLDVCIWFNCNLGARIDNFNTHNFIHWWLKLFEGEHQLNKNNLSDFLYKFGSNGGIIRESLTSIHKPFLKC